MGDDPPASIVSSGRRGEFTSRGSPGPRPGHSAAMTQPRQEDSTPDVTVVIPSFNSAEWLPSTFDALARAVRPAGAKVEVILVDDGSEDKSAYVVRKNFPQIKLIRHTKNRGFSASVNTGARAARGDLLVLLNTDVLPAHNSGHIPV